jgi:hypothetical protein
MWVILITKHLIYYILLDELRNLFLLTQLV